MKIQVAPYELKLRKDLGRSKSTVRKGALLKIEFPETGPGYADLHPWDELGDVPLAEQLDLLKGGTLTTLTRRSFEFAKRDSNARARGISLFQGLEIPPSHLLFTQTEEAMRAYEDGFRLFKLKLGKDIESGATQINSLASTFPEDVKFRIDFNEQLDLAAFHEFLKKIDPERIDFVEDPAPWEPHGWGKASVRLALDRNVGLASIEAWPEIAIIKPALNDPKTIAQSGRSFVVTSYLDHPLGQASAALAAAELARDFPQSIETCGLLTHWAYEENEFSAALQTSGTRLLPPEGKGLGFDSLLERQTWQDL